MLYNQLKYCLPNSLIVLHYVVYNRQQLDNQLKITLDCRVANQLSVSIKSIRQKVSELQCE